MAEVMYVHVLSEAFLEIEAFWRIEAVQPDTFWTTAVIHIVDREN